MAGYSFTHRFLPKTFSPSALYLYNTPAHLLLQSEKGWVVFELIGHKAKVCARICMNLKNKVAASPVRAPFGSCEMYAKVGSGVLGSFLSFVEETLLKKKVKHVLIKSWPVLYQATQATKLYNVLVNKLRFTTTPEVSSVIQVNKNTLLSQMKVSERQKAVKAAKLFSFNVCSAPQDKLVYDFILSCRKERNQTLSLSWNKLRQTVKAMPERFLFFSLASETDLAAAAVVIRVSDTIWYTFYYAHAAKYNKVSPVVYLLSCIYEYASKQKVKLIDLGTSMLDAKVNEPLLHFKQSVGAVTTSKFVFSKKYL
jgi:hypothetical protein